MGRKPLSQEEKDRRASLMKKVSQPKIATGRKTFEKKGKYCSINCEVFDFNPDTICIEVNSMVVFKDPFIKDITISNANNKVEKFVNKIVMQIFNESSPVLSHNIYPNELKNEMIFIGQEYQSDPNYLYAQVKHKRDIKMCIQFYIHTLNSIKKESCHIKFFDEDRILSEDTQVFYKFLDEMINNPLWTKNEFGVFKIKLRGESKLKGTKRDIPKSKHKPKKNAI
jgi:hypothetical protein